MTSPRTLLGIVVVLLTLAPGIAHAHSPVDPEDGQTLGTATHVADPAKSWAIYGDLREAEDVCIRHTSEAAFADVDGIKARPAQQHGCSARHAHVEKESHDGSTGGIVTQRSSTMPAAYCRA